MRQNEKKLFENEVEFYLEDFMFKKPDVAIFGRNKDFDSFLQKAMKENQEIKVINRDFNSTDNFRVAKEIKVGGKSYYFAKSVYDFKIKPILKNYKNVKMIASVETEK